MFILLVFTRGVSLVKSISECDQHGWFGCTEEFVLTEMSPGQMCSSVNSLEVLCKKTKKTIFFTSVVGEVLSVGKADC